MLSYMSLMDSADDKSKFERIYQSYKGLMFYTANRILNNPQDAEDAVHTAFVKIAENISKIQEAVCPKTKVFVVTIVENTAIDLYRKKKRRRKECVTHEIRITGIAWCKRKEGILRFPLFTFSLLLAAVREPDRELRHCRCHRKEELLHRLHQDRELHLHQALSFRCLRKALREP